jgi:hypothetical protein
MKMNRSGWRWGPGWFCVLILFFTASAWVVGQERDTEGVERDHDMSEFGEVAEILPQVLVATFRGESWQENGGRGTIVWMEEPSKRWLSIDQTPIVQDEIAGFLDCLRQVRKRGENEVQPLASNGYWKAGKVAQQIRDGLEAKIDISFEKTPLPEILELLSRRSGVEIRLDSATAAKRGGQEWPPTSAAFKQVPLADLLTAVVKPYELSLAVADDHVLVGRGSSLEMHESPAIYPVADLAGTDGMRALLQRLQTEVTPREWSQMGGSAVVMPVGNAMLVVKHSISGHREMARWLAKRRSE